MNPDLFPETLIVRVVAGQPMTNSLLIAEHFGKRHRDVLRAIHAIVQRSKCGRGERNFALSSYLSDGGKRLPMYLLNRDGFFFVAGGFTGAEADEWKWSFIEAFNAMEAELHAKTARFAAALDQVRPNLRPVVEGTQAGLNRAAIADPLGKSCSSVTYHRKAARRLGLLGEAA